MFEKIAYPTALERQVLTNLLGEFIVFQVQNDNAENIATFGIDVRSDDPAMFDVFVKVEEMIRRMVQIEPRLGTSVPQRTLRANVYGILQRLGERKVGQYQEVTNAAIDDAVYLVGSLCDTLQFMHRS